MTDGNSDYTWDSELTHNFAEYFVGKPGTYGTGTPIDLTNGQGTVNVASANKQVVYMHAQDAKGNWGPWTFAWSK